MLSFNESHIDLVDKIEDLDWLVYVEKEKVDKYNRFILFFSDENYILCTQERKTVHISYVIDKKGDENLPDKFISLLNKHFSNSKGWSSSFFNELAAHFKKPAHKDVDRLSRREIKYLMINAVMKEEYLEAAKYRDAITTKENKKS